MSTVSSLFQSGRSSVLFISTATLFFLSFHWTSSLKKSMRVRVCVCVVSTTSDILVVRAVSVITYISYYAVGSRSFYYGRTLSDASMLCFTAVFSYFFLWPP